MPGTGDAWMVAGGPVPRRLRTPRAPAVGARPGAKARLGFAPTPGYAHAVDRDEMLRVLDALAAEAVEDCER